MSKIISYQQNYDGTFSVVIDGVDLGNKDTLLLDNNIDVDVDVKVIDPFSITGKQRRLIFALCNDIEDYTGQPRDYMRYLFQDFVTFYYGQVIDAIIEWVFKNRIPIKYKTSDLMKDNKAFLYWATVTRHCVICGTERADLAHYEAVGRGMNRNKMNHYDKHVLALCRQHHNEQHAIGVKSFDDKYHLHNSWIKVDKKLNKMLKGEKHQ
ncbi:hypothetical protein CJ234_07730 [Staphylococcus sp. UMB0328]|uniref:putative HNHc nuclease n=1 Tax=Staphylococcus sp. UMB0328 TaxID=2029110 RepID=UPI000CC4C524|nr:putative HNHc nuclease [Staphylococcus sp. UMB0328]PMB95128.1 hypothetical protein CJ234_07730 [Staphylococcus sp. UMB0328]